MSDTDQMYKQAENFMYAREGKCDYAKAVELYTRAAEGGHIKAMKCLARIYRDGEIVVQDLALSLQYTTQSAQRGDVHSQFALANIYFHGKHAQKDDEKALQWYQTAAENGYDKAQNNLANMYKNGHGTQKDFVKAVYWYEKAAEAGNESAKNNLRNLVEYNTDAMVALGMAALEQGNRETAYEWIQKASEHNHTQALKLMGDEYARNGEEQKAASCYKQAAEQGNGEAAELAGDYLNKTSPRAAEKYYQIAVDKGIKSAAKKLADACMDERRLIKNRKKAQTYYDLMNKE